MRDFLRSMFIKKIKLDDEFGLGVCGCVIEIMGCFVCIMHVSEL